MPDVRKCAIFGCKSNSRDNRELKFFNFPARDNPVYNTWISICHESEEVLRSIQRPYICSRHFEPYYIGFRRLSMGALPTLFLKAPPGFAEKERARILEEDAAQRKKQYFCNLINKCVFKWMQRARYHPELKTIYSMRREIMCIATKIRNYVGATLIVPIDGYWLRKFRKTYMQDWNDDSSDLDIKQELQSLDLIEIIRSFDPEAKILSEVEIESLVEEEQKIVQQKVDTQHYPPEDYLYPKNAKKRSFTEALEVYYGIYANKKSKSNEDVEEDVVDLSQDDDGCFDVDAEDSQPVVVSEPIVDNYEQALEHLKPLEDFALRQEDYRVIGLLSTLEIIFKNRRSSKP